MADGTRKLISQVKRGDYVLAEDPETGKRGPLKVTRVWRHKDTVFKLLIDGAVIATREDRPFWNESDREWQAAQDLDKGDLVRTADGEPVAVGGIEHGRRERST